MLGRVLECRTVDNDDGDENEERETASLTMLCMTSNNMLVGPKFSNSKCILQTLKTIHNSSISFWLGFS